jgi:hypothetical protein
MIFVHDHRINPRGMYMATHMKPDEGNLTLAEIREFASFDPAAQRYIRRSLDVAYGRSDVVAVWSRSDLERASIRAQTRVYDLLPSIRDRMPVDTGIDLLEGFLDRLTRVTAFDLGQERISDFGPYRFLYERLLGAATRPWLPSAYCAAAALPNYRPARRRQLLQSISEAAATAPGWSAREPLFYPEFIETEVA